MGPSGDPLDVDTIIVHEQTVDGPIAVSPFRMPEDTGTWRFGVRGLKAGNRASFRVHAEVNDAPVAGTLVLEALGMSVDVAAGQVTLQ
ncbi:hypothetical protein Poly30_45620 [Planctomycetes bacterium Poly30]|uniref:Uncharacterized protein n=1 Tax=Saltatorellus ferox TaxID=2528018 RepID=A0A518EY38_9BACT|nr:hypothetical protein Poly30_45620 [Planctomycetes bacterium Poly30]